MGNQRKRIRELEVLLSATEVCVREVLKANRRAAQFVRQHEEERGRMHKHIEDLERLLDCSEGRRLKKNAAEVAAYTRRRDREEEEKVT